MSLGFKRLRSVKYSQGEEEHPTYSKRKTNWIGHFLRKNCLLKHVVEGNIQGTGRRGRRHKQLMDDHKERRRYWKLQGGSTASLCLENWVSEEPVVLSQGRERSELMSVVCN